MMKNQSQKTYGMPIGVLLVILSGCISFMNAILCYLTTTHASFHLIGLPGKLVLIAMLLHVLQAVGVIGLGIHLGKEGKGKFPVIGNVLLSALWIALVIFLRMPTSVAASARMLLERDYWLKVNVAIGLGAGTSLLYIVLMLVFVLNIFFVTAKRKESKTLDVLIVSAVMLLSALWSCFSETLLGAQFAHISAYVLLAIGLYLCAISKSKGKWELKSAKPYTTQNYLRMVAVFLLLGAAVVLISLERVGIALILLTIPIIYAVFGLRKDGTALAIDNQKIAFYNECIAVGITGCNSEKEVQRATLIAQKHNLKFADITVLYAEAKRLAETDMQNKQLAEEEAVRNHERSLCKEYTRYAELRGREKRIAMLTDEQKGALETAKRISAGMDAAIGATQQKEHDWATHGGIASGIAGPVAGAVVALDVQAKNARIREQNKANVRAMAPVVLESMKESGYYRKKAKELEAEIESAKTKLVADLDTAACFDMLTFYDEQVSVSATGTCTVTARTKLKAPLKIFEDVDAVIDGTILARIYEGDTLIETATMVIPVHGVASGAYLKGMCLFCCEAEKEYTVKFTAGDLWAMEV